MSDKQPKWYSIRKLAPIAAAAVGALAAAEIFIYGDIGESWYAETVTAGQFVKDLQALDAQQITVRINSVGGSVPDGLAIYNAIKRHAATITVEIDGMAFSVASLIAMAGDKVNMASNALLMIHAPWTYVAGNSVELREMADQLDTWAAAMSTSYAAKTGEPQADMLALLTDGVDHYYTAAEALAGKFIDSVSDAMPASAMASAARDMAASKRYPGVPAAWLQACRGEPAAAPAPAATPAATPAPSAAAAAQTQEPEMPDPKNAGGDTLTPEARKQVLVAERDRQSAIEAKFKPFLATAGVPELLAKLRADDGVTVEAAGEKLLAHMGATAEPVGGGRVVTTEDERDKVRAAMTNSILARSGVVISKQGDGRVRVDASNPFRGRKLLALAEACLQAAGVRTQGMDQRAIVGAAFTQSGSDFPVLLETAMYKVLQGAYQVQADTWTAFCKQGSVGDFRAHNRYRVGSLSNLDTKTELNEFKNKAIPDGEKASVQIGTKGNIINLSREAIIDDDLAIFTDLAAALGRAAKRTVEADVYATLALNAGMGPTLADGVTLFHANHNNVSTGAPTVVSFEAARVVMRAQKDVSGNDFLDLTPSVWLGSDAAVGAAKVVNNSTYDPDANNKLQRANISYQAVSAMVSSPRLSALPWYFFADKDTAPVIEVDFLDGITEPYVELENGFTVDGARWKVRLDYGVAGVDFRGAVRSTGA